VWIATDGFNNWSVIVSFSSYAALLSEAQQWSAMQYQQPLVLTSESGHVQTILTYRDRFTLTMTEDSEVDYPNGVASGMKWQIDVKANGTNELTWEARYDWGTVGAPDISAMADGEHIVLRFYVVFDSPSYKIFCEASPVFS
jgi:hypothetical protein